MLDYLKLRKQQTFMNLFTFFILTKINTRGNFRGKFLDTYLEQNSFCLLKVNERFQIGKITLKVKE
jgi:hypothetical protein